MAGSAGPGGVRAYRLRDTVLDGGVARAEKEIFDGVDTSLRSLLTFAPLPARPPQLGARSRSRSRAAVAEARKALAAGGEAAAVAPLDARAQGAARGARVAGVDEPPEDARYEIDFRLAQKEPQFAQALMLAADVRLDAVARDGLVVAGQPLQVDLLAANRGRTAVERRRSRRTASAPAPVLRGDWRMRPGSVEQLRLRR